MKEEIKFKLGDRVYAPFHGYGVVTAIHEDACVYPIEVTWDDSGLKNMEDVSTFTADGLLSKYYANTDTILTVVKGSHKRNRRKEMSASKFKVGDRIWITNIEQGTIVRFCPNEETCIVNSDFDGEVEMRIDGLEKVEYTAVNPSHYRVEGIPEAIEIMEHLMTKEQFEGFLWGNILKYAYRYGRKGDKKETAGKIEWYAKRLEEVLKGEHNET